MGESLASLASPLLALGLLVAAFALLLADAEIFTNAVEWLGHHLGVSESATGSLLAAVGTALPETMIPVTAIVSVPVGRGDQATADEVGVGAILGAPFMLATIGMSLIGASVLYFGLRSRPTAARSSVTSRFSSSATRWRRRPGSSPGAVSSS